MIAKLAVSCYQLIPSASMQEELSDSEQSKKRNVSDALDAINDKYGEYVITPALMLGLDSQIVDRIAFGGVKELEEIYAL